MAWRVPKTGADKQVSHAGQILAVSPVAGRLHEPQPRQQLNQYFLLRHFLQESDGSNRTANHQRQQKKQYEEYFPAVLRHRRAHIYRSLASWIRSRIRATPCGSGPRMPEFSAAIRAHLRGKWRARLFLVVIGTARHKTFSSQDALHAHHLQGRGYPYRHPQAQRQFAAVQQFNRRHGNSGAR
ncbi:hypothetical protein D3C72_1336000 [compost metagenome]